MELEEDIFPRKLVVSGVDHFAKITMGNKENISIFVFLF